MKKTRIFVALSIFWLALASLACGAIGFPEPYLPTPEPPTDGDRPTLEPIISFEMEAQSAQTEAAQNNGSLTLTINEHQLELMLKSKLQTQASPYMWSPLVSLDDGEIKISGDLTPSYTQGKNDTGVLTVLSANIGAEGNPVIAVISTGSELPLKKTISAFFAETLTDGLRSATFRFRLKSITISKEGIILTGQAKYIGEPEPDWCATPTNNNLAICFDSFNQKIQAAQTAAAPNGILMLTIREDQITSWLTSKQDPQTNTFLYHRVRLIDRNNGIISVFCDVRQNLQDNAWAQIRIDLLANIDAEGRPVIAITYIGPTSQLAEGLDKTISESVAKTFNDMLNQATSGFRLESITITYGVITLTGKAK